MCSDGGRCWWWERVGNIRRSILKTKKGKAIVETQVGQCWEFWRFTAQHERALPAYNAVSVTLIYIYIYIDNMYIQIYNIHACPFNKGQIWYDLLRLTLSFLSISNPSPKSVLFSVADYQMQGIHFFSFFFWVSLYLLKDSLLG